MNLNEHEKALRNCLDQALGFWGLYRTLAEIRMQVIERGQGNLTPPLELAMREMENKINSYSLPVAAKKES